MNDTIHYFQSKDTAWEFAKLCGRTKSLEVIDYGIDADRPLEPYFISIRCHPPYAL